MSFILNPIRLAGLGNFTQVQGNETFKEKSTDDNESN
jgi:hypothetical protein